MKRLMEVLNERRERLKKVCKEIIEKEYDDDRKNKFSKLLEEGIWGCGFTRVGKERNDRIVAYYGEENLSLLIFPITKYFATTQNHDYYIVDVNTGAYLPIRGYEEEETGEFTTVTVYHWDKDILARMFTEEELEKLARELRKGKPVTTKVKKFRVKEREILGFDRENKKIGLYEIESEYTKGLGGAIRKIKDKEYRVISQDKRLQLELIEERDVPISVYLAYECPVPVSRVGLAKRL